MAGRLLGIAGWSPEAVECLMAAMAEHGWLHAGSLRNAVDDVLLEANPVVNLYPWCEPYGYRDMRRAQTMAELLADEKKVRGMADKIWEALDIDDDILDVLGVAEDLSAGGDDVAVTGVRFASEVRAIRDLGGVVMWLGMTGSENHRPDGWEHQVGPMECQVLLGAECLDEIHDEFHGTRRALDEELRKAAEARQVADPLAGLKWADDDEPIATARWDLSAGGVNVGTMTVPVTSDVCVGEPADDQEVLVRCQCEACADLAEPLVFSVSGLDRAVALRGLIAELTRVRPNGRVA